MSKAIEDTAQRIADRGREMLLARLRPAFEQAAAAHADVLSLDPEQVETMVQRAADRADGLQWRRALASVASEELGIRLGEALRHPSVARAQAILGAPTYEESSARLGRTRETAAAQPIESAEPQSTQTAKRQSYEAGVESIETGHDADILDPVTLEVVHRDGVVGLAPGEAETKLHAGPEGLEILRANDDRVGRLGWEEIRGIEVSRPRRNRRRPRHTELVLHTSQGEASFQVPTMSPEDLNQRLAPLRERYLSD